MISQLEIWEQFKSMKQNLLPQVYNYYHLNYWEDLDHWKAPKGFVVYEDTTHIHFTNTIILLKSRRFPKDPELILLSFQTATGHSFDASPPTTWP